MLRMVKQRIKRTLPNAVQQWLLLEKRREVLAANFQNDIARFQSASLAAKQESSKANLRALITMDYHRLEKGMALKEPRPGFGREVADRLLRNIQRYNAHVQDGDVLPAIAMNVLSSYFTFQQSRGVPCTELRELYALVKQDLKSHGLSDSGGVQAISRDHVLRSIPNDMDKFFLSRHSVRHYDSRAVARTEIEAALRLALRTPSVCNRQCWRVYCIQEPTKKATVLALQNGNSGFGDQASWVAVIAADLRVFVSVGERNQCWVDGGMFAMSFAYALHSQGLAACFLNWSVEVETDTRLRRILDIPSHEVIITLMSIGNYPESFVVAQSPRLEVAHVAKFE